MTPPSARGRVLGTFLAVVVALAGGCGSQAPDRLDTSRAQPRIESALAKAYDVPVDQVRCPTRITVRSGATFRCQARIAGQPVDVAVTQRSAAGDLQVEPEVAVIHADKVATDIKTRLDAQFGRPFLVGCGALLVRVLSPGTTFTCQAGDGTSQRQVTVTVKDRAGTVAYDVGS